MTKQNDVLQLITSCAPLIDFSLLSHGKEEVAHYVFESDNVQSTVTCGRSKSNKVDGMTQNDRIDALAKQYFPSKRS